MSLQSGAPGRPKVSPLYDPRLRGLAYQAVLLFVVGFLVFEAVVNAATNMRARGIPTNFDFWNRTSGFDINFTLIDYSSLSTYGDAFWVGLLNTLLVAAIGIIGATIVGFVVGIARLSPNWIVAKLATFYVETIRNVPLLLQLLFWYNAVLKPLPLPREAIKIFGLAFDRPDVVALSALGIAGAGWLLWLLARRSGGAAFRMAATVGGLLALFALFAVLLGGLVFPTTPGAGLLRWSDTPVGFLSNRGLMLPQPMAGEGAGIVFAAFLVALAVGALYALWARRRQQATGARQPVTLVIVALVCLLPAGAIFVGGNPFGLTYPQLRGFNFTGGLRLLPELFALVLGLTLYTASFIAEIVRAGIQSVARGQSEAAQALGLSMPLVRKLVVVPQAMRVIVPPLTNQYLNLTKNSSLAVFIGYPDLVQIFAGTVLNQTGAAVQVIAITMAVYLLISLVTSAIMDVYNRRIALVER